MMNYTAAGRYAKLFLATVLLIVSIPVFLSLQQKGSGAVPVFSAESGFYENGFYLEITAPEGYDVYYTLDSDTPDIFSDRYSGPIYIENTSGKSNRYAQHPNLSSGLPNHTVDKCTVVRAIAVPRLLSGLKQSRVVTKSYFVGYPEAYFDDCGIVSLVTDPDNLFDNRIGIYVTGNVLQRYYATTDQPEEQTWKLPANYTQKGKKWEREASATVWAPDRTLQMTKDVGIRIQGGANRFRMPKSLNLYARTEYDGVPYFETDLLGGERRLTTLNLTAGGNSPGTQLNDYLMSARVYGMPYSVMRYKPYVMFLDGEYWGFYWLTESYNGDYLRQVYDLGGEDVIIIKEAAVDEGYDGDLALYRQMTDFFNSADMSLEENYVKACEMIDISSFTDYYATLVYIARTQDWPVSNESLWRTRNVSDAPYADGKWRWMLFDCNAFCMEESLTEHNTLEYAIEKSEIFRSLWNNAQFRERFRTRILEIADQCFAAEDMSNFLEEFRQNMLAPVTRSRARFTNDREKAETSFLNKLAGHEAFFRNRRAVVESWFS